MLVLQSICQDTPTRLMAFTTTPRSNPARKRHLKPCVGAHIRTLVRTWGCFCPTVRARHPLRSLSPSLACCLFCAHAVEELYLSVTLKRSKYSQVNTK